jgi:hypothetical protein
MELTKISGHQFVRKEKVNFSYKLKQPLKVIMTQIDGEFFAKAGNEFYQIVASGDTKEDALQDFCLEFHLRVLDLTFDKSISCYKKTYDFLSKYINI